MKQHMQAQSNWKKKSVILQPLTARCEPRLSPCVCDSLIICVISEHGQLMHRSIANPWSTQSSDPSISSDYNGVHFAFSICYSICVGRISQWRVSAKCLNVHADAENCEAWRCCNALFSLEYRRRKVSWLMFIFTPEGYYGSCTSRVHSILEAYQPASTQEYRVVVCGDAEISQEGRCAGECHDRSHASTNGQIGRPSLSNTTASQEYTKM